MSPLEPDDGKQAWHPPKLRELDVVEDSDGSTTPGVPKIPAANEALSSGPS